MSILDSLKKSAETTNKAKQRRQLCNEITDRLNRNIKEDQAKFPDKADTINGSLPLLRRTAKRYLGLKRVSSDPYDALPVFFVSEDNMTAFVCVFPPEEGGEDITLEMIKKSQHYEGIANGIFEDREQQLVREREYLHMIPIARGHAPKEGRRCEISERFRRLPPFRIAVGIKEEVSFKNMQKIQLVHKGDTVCIIKPAVPGRDGIDVMGNVLKCRDIEDFKVPVGRHTRLSEDKLSLVADNDGLLYWNDDKWNVLKATIVEGKLSGGKKDVAGHLYITGDVCDGAEVIATGDILIMGEVASSNVRSTNGSIRVIKGVRDAVIEAKSQVQLSEMTDSKVKAGEYVYAEVIEQCDVTCLGTVLVGGARGLVLGGYVKAKEQVFCRKIGNMSGTHTKIAVGYQPELMSELHQLNAALDEVQGTLAVLRKSISNLRMAGSTLSMEKRNVLVQLVDQRDAYDSREAELLKRQKEVRKKLRQSRTGRLSFNELWPVVEVQIGDKKGVFREKEGSGSIHIYSNQVLLTKSI